ncbi:MULTISPECIES: hypothetical protein [Streptomyces]|uniref:Uncharacterized protein n=1 Tax=Streptomyces clavifer TaxID=68188 RepID=A0ABS4V8Y4_9ACTN|nr:MULTISPECIES: hypothetical protein [Streptomyces]MBP2360159.1 hypothetical protein [Streptomyces clavifer]MDQ0795033.1 hypothetical protein [Streptomyces sp. B1I3]MDX2743319.1 hypothetical protein [Streptomyces sp. NRRL_B-2557]MDX3066713.1 hypothetical protein [Streptomyces sp. ND04-05B]WRY83232.1 hypothetical protein OG388_19375 [Streptomyces clavifer]
MNPLDRSTWDAALLRLLEDVFVFARSGPRLHGDWAEDVLAVMERSVADPRGWFALDSETFQEGWEAGCPGYPFRVTAAQDLRAGLRPITAGAAVELLASLSQEWFFEGSPVRSREDRDAVLADARTVLDRFGPEAAFWTSSGLARTCDAPDFLAGDLEGGHPFTGYMMDLGLIAVSADEVGVFWSFNAN